MITTYTKEQLKEKLKEGSINDIMPSDCKFYLFAGKDYIPWKGKFSIYQEFDNLSEFLASHQKHIDSGLNVLSFAL